MAEIPQLMQRIAQALDAMALHTQQLSERIQQPAPPLLAEKENQENPAMSPRAAEIEARITAHEQRHAALAQAAARAIQLEAENKSLREHLTQLDSEIGNVRQLHAQISGQLQRQRSRVIPSGESHDFLEQTNSAEMAALHAQRELEAKEIAAVLAALEAALGNINPDKS